MLYVCKKTSDGKYLVMDTDDNTKTKCSTKQLYDYYKLGINIYGVSESSISVFKPAELSEVIDTFLKIMKRYSNWSQEDRDNLTGMCCIRDWGQWLTPGVGADSDWATLSFESKQRLSEILDELRKKYPDVAVYASTAEFEWIEFHVYRKNNLYRKN